MKKHLYLLLALLILLSQANLARATGEITGLDFNSMNEYHGANYTITYPAGYDKELAFLVNRVDKAIPFVESYGAIQFDNIQIEIIPSTAQLLAGSAMSGDAIIQDHKIQIPADYYDQPVVVHELCHLAQYPLLDFPSWFQEAHAENCSRRYFESVEACTTAQSYTDYYTSKIDRLKNTSSMIPQDIITSDLNSYGLAVKEKTAMDYYFLMDELLKYVNMADILTHMRQDFQGDVGTTIVTRTINGQQENLIALSNDSIICEINKLASKDIVPIFEKYGFPAPACNGAAHISPPSGPANIPNPCTVSAKNPSAQTLAKKPGQPPILNTQQTPSSAGIAPIFSVIQFFAIVVFWGGIGYLIWWLRKRKKNAK